MKSQIVVKILVLILKANYNKYHATIDCYFPDLIESILI